VLATGGVPALLALMHWFSATTHMWQPFYLAFLACCSGDTFASELGVLARQTPRLITTWQRVPAGRDGGITLAGTCWSIAGGALVGAAACAGWPTVLQGAVFGGIGSVFDSVLGAVLQAPGCYPPAQHKMYNVLVNFLSASATMALVPWYGLLASYGILLLVALLVALALDSKEVA
jgi:uncharacterized protein (TIGR00297 family)